MYTCMRAPSKIRNIKLPLNWSNSVEHRCECWKPKMGLQQEQCVFLSTDPSL